MLAQYWLLLAAVLALLCNQRLLRRLLLRSAMGRTRCWRLRAASDGTLRARGCRLRLYGVGAANDTTACRKLIDGRSLRWRVLSVDRDGTLAILLRVDGRNVAVELLQLGVVGVRGTGARRYRAAQPAWRAGEGGESVRPFGLVFPWWQG